MCTAALRKQEVEDLHLAGRGAVQHVDSDAGRTLGRRDSGLNLGSEPQIHC